MLKRITIYDFLKFIHWMILISNTRIDGTRRKSKIRSKKVKVKNWQIISIKKMLIKVMEPDLLQR